MWQYTTETIINSEKGHLENGKRFAVIAAKDGKVITTGAGPKDFVVIDGVLTARICDINCIHKTEYVPEANAEYKLDLAGLNYVAGDVLRLKVVLHQQGQVSSIFQNAYLKHNKPFFFEIVAKGNADEDAEALVKAIKREMQATDFKFFKAEVDAAKVSQINFEGADCYIRFTEIQLAKVEADNAATGAALLGYENYTVLANGDVVTVGSEGMGTVRQLVKNLRIPTDANTNPFGVDFGGKPVPGGKYDQYLIELVSDRRHVGGQVMGALDQSITSHVFFINQDLSTEWDAFIALIDINNELTTYMQADMDPDSPKTPDSLVAKTDIGSVQ